MLKQVFIDLMQKYSDNNIVIEKLWNEIEENYADEKRHYHTLTHLDNLFKQLIEVKAHIEDWDTIICSLFYHDVIYNASKNDNEEKSAEMAKEKLRLLNFPEEKIAKCMLQILATKSHLKNTDNDTNIFTDADLSILGCDWNMYSEYFKQVRKEYSVYPDFMYKPGRKKVLNHFLGMDRIYKTDLFYNKFETTARQNLKRELEEL
ncbi:MAG TPA: hypothetical protein VKG26_10435 [Bacteroidia bacterium]|nr:hypothetical protein [Bacteroidia bacterium]